MARNSSLETGELTDTAFYILLSLLQTNHGYLIMKSIESMTDGQFSIGPASLYTTIKKLLAAELIKRFETDLDNKKRYIATEKGIDLLKKEVVRRKEMVLHAEKLFNQIGACEK